MNYLVNGLFILGIVFTGIGIKMAMSGHISSSRQLAMQAMKHCADVPELDAQRMYCAAAYIEETCELDGLDLRLCGKLSK